jgi:hypothetical protein
MANRLFLSALMMILVWSSGCVDGGGTNKKPALQVNFVEINMCFKEVGQTYTWQNMQMVNTGSADLTIAAVEIRGDVNCAFKCFREPADTEPSDQFYECKNEHENSAPFQMTVPPGEARILKIEFTPSQVGVTDKAALAITSDASNFTVSSEAVDGTADDYIWQKRLVPMCGTGIDTELADGGCEEVDAGCGDPLTADSPGCGEI